VGLPILFRGAAGGPPAITGTAAFTQTAASWDATGSEKFSGTGTFLQTQVWSATALEKFSATATFLQTQDWAATGNVIAPVTGTATFDQAAASWLATESEIFTGSAAFIQTQVWDAAALERFSGTASFDQTQAWLGLVNEVYSGAAAFDQSQSWDATGSIPTGPYIGTASFTQTQDWSAQAAVPVTVEPGGIAWYPKVIAEPPIELRARFVQGQSWRAEGTVRESENWLIGVLDESEEALLLGV
jgi:hypothetical protein